MIVRVAATAMMMNMDIKWPTDFKNKHASSYSVHVPMCNIHCTYMHVNESWKSWLQDQIAYKTS